MYEGPIQDLIDELGRLPGIGPKSAQRLAFHILAADRDDVLRLADVLKLVKETVKFCEVCFTLEGYEPGGWEKDVRGDRVLGKGPPKPKAKHH